MGAISKNTYWSFVDTLLPGIMVAAIVLCIGAEIVTRKFFNYSLVWLLEGVDLGYTWLVFLAGAGVFRLNQAIVVDSVFMYLPRGLQHWVLCISHALTACMAIYLTYMGIALSFALAAQKTTVIKISFSWQTAALSVGMGITAISGIVKLCKLLRSPANMAAHERKGRLQDEKES